MAIELKLSNNYPTRLYLASKWYLGATTEPGGTSYPTTTSHSFFIWDKGTTPTGKLLAWGNPTSTQRVCVRGVDIGAAPSGRLDKELWWSTLNGGELRFVRSGRMYSPNRNIFTNSVPDTQLLLYTNSARTSLLASMAYGFTGTTSVYATTYYARLRGATRTQDTYDFVINANAGFAYDVTGSYTASTDDQYNCSCGNQQAFSGRANCAPRSGIGCTMNIQLTGCDQEGEVCYRTCNQDPIDFTYYGVEEFCYTSFVSSGSAASWSSIVASRTN